MDAVILAGGLGTRLRPSVEGIPKCLAPILGKPFLWYVFTYLSKYNIERVVLSVGYLRDAIYDWVSKIVCQLPFEIEYAVEDSPLGTGGGIRNAMSKVKGDNFFVLNGDTLFCVDLDNFVRRHVSSDCDISLALKPLTCFDRYGSVEYDYSTGKVVSFKEKKYCKEGLINGGVYLISKDSSVFDGFADRFSFESQVLEKQCCLNNLNGFVQNSFFIDIGVPEDYMKAQSDFMNFNEFI